MLDRQAVNGRRSFPMRPHYLALVLAGAAAFMTLWIVQHLLPPAQWWQAVFHPARQDLAQIDVHFAVMPRLCLALLAGGALGLAGVIFQQVLRNPMAEPATLGVSAGAYLALSLAAIWLPGLSGSSRQAVALLGAVAAMAIVLGLSWRKGLSPLALILAGLIVGLYCGAFNTALILFQDKLRTLTLWGSGSLDGQDWLGVRDLASQSALVVVLLFVLRRPLNLLGLEDAGASSLGLSLQRARMIVLALAVILSAAVVSTVGVISFIGIGAPMLARMAGARTLGQRLLWSALIGATLLWFADDCLQVIDGALHVSIPTGAAAALFGGPILLFLLPRMRQMSRPVLSGGGRGFDRRTRAPLRGILVLVACLVGAVLVSLAFGKGISGWQWSGWRQMQALSFWRGPPMVAAAAAGAMLAVAGSLLQRLTGNPMASPEVLGVSTGAALGVIALVLIAPGFGRPVQILASGGGATVALGLMLLWGRRSGFAPDQMLLGGVTLAMAFTGILAVLLASGDPRMIGLLAWISGSTYLVRWPDALSACLIGGVLALAVPVQRRWLEILPLGDGLARSLGTPLASSRLAILLVASCFTGIATLVVGPLSFVGLMAPHMARSFCQSRPLPQLVASAILGALIMVLANWAGRVLLFPNQMPAGLVATLLGGTYLMIQLARRPR
ncbi:Fe(3+)-hydroxamate ABC transporter permease FhuB [Acidisoma cellulosilytica]|uniref:Fe(3+)-hydroxamate ABC transporter permease FhuB n=1 Tax=Acidisoma cellulosilyticum TaxID=2802395 RepID=A0A963Z846_9PROT|nr:Fe(3+)-hydroxamate ABC transporter permease FhuB [Acidisoma cellulosilyticum]MCB8883598.1 Fe(3+)-hydroxamate ABC transporter permease FhuB [Acidisoma cellulosilyticum]